MTFYNNKFLHKRKNKEKPNLRAGAEEDKKEIGFTISLIESQRSGSHWRENKEAEREKREHVRA